MFKQFHRRVQESSQRFFRVHLPKAVGNVNRFLTSAINVGKTGHRLLTHVNQNVAKSELFTPEQKARVAKGHAFAGSGLQKFSDLSGKVQSFGTGLAEFRL